MLLLLLLLLWMGALSCRAQSGDEDPDLAPALSCMSHLSFHQGNSISCQLVSRGDGPEDDEDEDDSIEKLTACCCIPWRCLEAWGESLTSKRLNWASLINVTAQTKGGRSIQAQVDLKKIIKPQSPQVSNVTLSPDHALVHVRIPYDNDYLNEDSLLFQLQLWSQKTNLTQNMSSLSLHIGGGHLLSDTQYQVKARAIPCDTFQGSWSEWSRPYSFHTPPDTGGCTEMWNISSVRGEETGGSPESLHFLWSILPLVTVVVTAAFFWKNKILTYMWPTIPHPKTTLVQICRPHTGLFYVPEEFSALSVYTAVSQSAGPSCSDTGPEPSSAGTDAAPSCSTHSSDTSASASSNNTEELELLSQSSASEEDVPREELNTVPETPPAELPGPLQERDHSYVTMSSFYQIKTAAAADRTPPINLIQT